MFARTSKVEKAFRRFPQVPLFARLADEYLRKGRALRAQTLCEEGCERFPRYPTGFFVLGRCYASRGMWQQARSALDRGLHLDADNPAGLRQLAGVHRRLGEERRALECLERAAVLDPLSPRLARELSSPAFEAQPREADGDPVAGPGPPPGSPSSASRPAPAVGPDSKPSVSRFGAPEDAELTTLLQDIDRPEEAGGEPAEGEMDERGPVPTVTLARLYARQGFPEQALETYRRVLSVDPGNQDARRGAEALTAT